MKKFWVCSFVMLSVFGAAAAASANDGDLDLTWGGTGTVNVNISNEDYVVKTVAYGTARVEAIGSVEVGAGPAMAMLLMRFQSDGSLDTSCNGSGYSMFTTVDPTTATDVAVLEDGSTLVAGVTFGTNPSGVVVKFLPNCQLDMSFGTGGVLIYSDRQGTSFTSIDVLDDNSIIVGGFTNFAPADGGGTRFTVLRATSAGSLDISFGNNGNGVFLSDGNHIGVVNDLFVDGQDRIIFVGTREFGGTDDVAIARLTASGQLDTSYASSGWHSPNGPEDERLLAVAPRPAGGLISVGSEVSTTSSHFGATLLCLTTAGLVDSSCGVPGVVTGLAVPAGVVDTLFWGVVVDDIGRFVISGSYDDPNVSGGQITPMVVRLGANGGIDTTFGTQGLVTLPFSPGHATNISLDKVGRVVVGGHRFGMSTIEGPITRLTGTTSTTTSTIAPSLLPATGRTVDATTPIVIVLFGLVLLVVRRVRAQSAQ